MYYKVIKLVTMDTVGHAIQLTYLMQSVTERLVPLYSCYGLPFHNLLRIDDNNQDGITTDKNLYP